MDQGKPSISVTVRSSYGRDLIYPVCPKAAAFARLVGQKTLSPDAVDQIKALGFDVVVLAPALPVPCRGCAAA